MGSASSKPTPTPAPAATTSTPTNIVKTEGDEKAQKCKPCCACPETRKARDMCIVERGEEECRDLIEAHKECMRKLGYKVA